MVEKWCQCKIPSPSAHYENCINNGCGRYIPDHAEVMKKENERLKEEIIKLKSHSENLNETPGPAQRGVTLSIPCVSGDGEQLCLQYGANCLDLSIGGGTEGRFIEIADPEKVQEVIDYLEETLTLMRSKS